MSSAVLSGSAEVDVGGSASCRPAPLRQQLACHHEMLLQPLPTQIVVLSDETLDINAVTPSFMTVESPQIQPKSIETSWNQTQPSYSSPPPPPPPPLPPAVVDNRVGSVNKAVERPTIACGDGGGRQSSAADDDVSICDRVEGQSMSATTAVAAAAAAECQRGYSVNTDDHDDWPRLTVPEFFTQTSSQHHPPNKIQKKDSEMESGIETDSDDDVVPDSIDFSGNEFTVDVEFSPVKPISAANLHCSDQPKHRRSKGHRSPSDDIVAAVYDTSLSIDEFIARAMVRPPPPMPAMMTLSQSCQQPTSSEKPEEPTVGSESEMRHLVTRSSPPPTLPKPPSTAATIQMLSELASKSSIAVEPDLLDVRLEEQYAVLVTPPPPPVSSDSEPLAGKFDCTGAPGADDGASNSTMSDSSPLVGLEAKISEKSFHDQVQCIEVDHASQASSTNFTPTSSLPPLPPLKLDRLLNTRPEMTSTTARTEIDNERNARSSTPAASTRSPILGRQLSLPIGCCITLPGSSLTQQPTASCIRQVSECFSSGTSSPSTSPQDEDDPRRLMAALLQSPPSVRYRRLLQNNASMLSTSAVLSSSLTAASSPTSSAMPSTTVRSRPPSPPPRISSVHHSPQLVPATTEPGMRGGRSRGYSPGYTGFECAASLQGPFPGMSSSVMSNPTRTLITGENAIYCNIVNGRCSPTPAAPPSTLSIATTSTCIATKRRDSTSSTASDAPSCSSRSSRTADIRRPSTLRTSSSAVVEQHHSAIIVDRSPLTSRLTVPASTSTIVPDDNWSSPSGLPAALNRRSLSLTHQQTGSQHGGDESKSMFDSIRLKLRSYWSKRDSHRSSRSMKSSADFEGLTDYRQSLHAASGNSSRSTLTSDHHGGRNLLRKSPSPSSSSVHSFMDRSFGHTVAGRRDLNGSSKVSDDDDDDDVTISPEHEFRKVTSDDGSDDLSIGNSPIATRNSRTSGSFKSFTGYL